MRILMTFRYGNIYPADRLKYVFQTMGHGVVTVGPSTDPVEHHDWEQADFIDKTGAVTGIYYYDVAKVIRKFGKFDFILQVEPSTYFYNLDKVDTPNAIWEIDTLLLRDNQYIQKIGGSEYIDQIGHIFTAKYNHLPQYTDDGIDKVSHLPLACDPSIHKEFEEEKKYDVVFAGNHTYAERQHYFKVLREAELNFFMGKAVGDDYCRVMAQGKVAFNHGHVGEMNMRFFELMAMGAFQVCNIVHGQELLGFEDRIHLVNYVTDQDLVNVVAEFVNQPGKRKRIAQTGKEKVLAEHTYQHRAEQLLRTCGLAK